MGPPQAGNSSPPVLVHHAVDVEIHRSPRDKRLYALDFARALPAECGDATYETRRLNRGSHLLQLLRPEFVKNYSQPLSADALSKFTMRREDRITEYNENRAASNALIEDVISRFAASGDTIWCVTEHDAAKNDVENNLLLLSDLRETMHRNGINMRFLGMLYAKTDNTSSPYNYYKKSLLLTEMIARVAKHDISREFRRVTTENDLPGTVKFQKAATDYLNMLLSHPSTSSRGGNFWGGTLLSRLHTKYGKFFNEDDERLMTDHDDGCKWRSSLLVNEEKCSSMLGTLYCRVVDSIGLKLDSHNHAYLAANNLNSRVSLQSFDVAEVRTAGARHFSRQHCLQRRHPTVSVYNIFFFTSLILTSPFTFTFTFTSSFVAWCNADASSLQTPCADR